jgi:hypothetical protein
VDAVNYDLVAIALVALLFAPTSNFSGFASVADFLGFALTFFDNVVAIDEGVVGTFAVVSLRDFFATALEECKGATGFAVASAPPLCLRGFAGPTGFDGPTSMLAFSIGAERLVFCAGVEDDNGFVAGAGVGASVFRFFCLGSPRATFSSERPEEVALEPVAAVASFFASAFAFITFCVSRFFLTESSLAF